MMADKLWAMTAWVGLALLGCGKGPGSSSGPTAAGSGASPPSTATPVDHLAPGELAESKVSLFGLRMPYAMRLQFQFDTEALAVGEVEPEQVANYVRARVTGGKLSVGASQTLFEDVHVGTDARPLRIKIERLKGLCRLEVRDTTPPPPPPGPPPQNDVERWRRAGYNPDGTLIDPMHAK
jgi:hypothetical protein